MSQSGPETTADQTEDDDEELILESQTVVNGPNLLPNIGLRDDEETTG